MKKLHVAFLSILIVLTSAFATPSFAQNENRHRGASVKVINQSKWEIHHLYLSSHASDDWGPDQLGEEVLAKGQQFTLTHLRCDRYDIRVVDEDGDECIIEDVSLCRDASYWKITDKALLDCENQPED